MKLLVVNADDLGYDPAIDRGILEAHAHGIVTSTTAMVDTPFAPDALRAAPLSLGVGLHLILEPGLPAGRVEAEVRRQLARFAALRGAPPTHLDSHKHAHAAPAVRDVLAAVAVAEGLPVRAIDGEMRSALRARGVAVADRFLGDASLRPAWTLEALLRSLATLGEGVTEVMTHPGHAPSHARTSFGAEREIELAALCDPTVRAILDGTGVVLCNYAEVRPHLGRG